MDNLKRVIVDFKKLTPELLKMLVEKYPDGYDDKDVVQFKNIKGELIKAVEVSAEDTRYLVKISTNLAHSMAKFEDDDDTILDTENMDELPDTDFYNPEEE